MKHGNMRYYIMFGLAGFISLTFAFLVNAERQPVSILFTAILLGLPLAFFFLFVDFTLTITGKYVFMKYFYLLVFAAFITQTTSSFYNLSALGILSNILFFSIALATVCVIALFASYALRMGHEGLQSDTSHPIHKLADAYQKQKENPKSWEEQTYDFFAEKIQGLRGKQESTS